jgi:hypothetical protein
MGLLDWLSGGNRKGRSPESIALIPPWRRGSLGEIFCSDTCYENAGRGMLASSGKNKPCCFCSTEVSYGQAGVMYMPFLTEPNLVCPRCHQKAKKWNARQKECSLCGKVFDIRSTTVDPTSSEFKCATCSTTIVDWHYDFESIVLAQSVGSQCSSCGMVRCTDHKESRCSNCGGDVVRLSKGPAESSTVDDARKRGKYNQVVRSPAGGRAVVDG